MSYSPSRIPTFNMGYLSPKRAVAPPSLDTLYNVPQRLPQVQSQTYISQIQLNSPTQPEIVCQKPRSISQLNGPAIIPVPNGKKRDLSPLEKLEPRKYDNWNANAKNDFQTGEGGIQFGDWDWSKRQQKMK
ncbi:Hypothetical_protein [Hexamita inflata]|uniref:Hypothetical_protein n=1 Tax=Hexamita inflata TaxID=28002 RepID=A0ABP1IAB1_9EUKA